jgi:hypothetical protein
LPSNLKMLNIKSAPGLIKKGRKNTLAGGGGGMRYSVNPIL